MACYVLSFDGIAEKIRIPSSSDTFDFNTFVQDLQKIEEKESYEISQLKETTPMKDEVDVPDPKNVLFYSGGAKGADTQWGLIAREYGYNINHIYVQDYNSWSPSKKKEIEDQYQSVVHALNRRLISSQEYTGQLVRRDMEQANLADSIVALAPIDVHGVTGGTAYAVARGIERKIPIYVYDLNSNKWKQYNYSTMKYDDYNNVPLLTNHAALIGSRSTAGKEDVERVIRQVFDKFVSTKSHLEKIQQLPQSATTVTPNIINIFYGSNEHPELSNFVTRKFTYKGKKFNNVETAFQWSKLEYANPQQPKEIQIWASAYTGSVTADYSKKIGRHIEGLNIAAWDANSSRIMEEIMRESFKQNPDAVNQLLATGNAVLTHTQDNTKWRTEFPRILTKLRQEFGNQEDTTAFDFSKDLIITNNSSLTGDVAKALKGIDTLRHPDKNGMHFGNPFSHTNYTGVQVVLPTVKDAVIAYEQWLRGEKYQDIEPERRQWIVNQITSKALLGKQLVYYTDKVPDNSYGRPTYDYDTAPNHAHILLKLIQEQANPSKRATQQVLQQNSWGSVNTTITALENNTELSAQEKKSIKSILGDTKPKVLVASEHTDPVFHAKQIKDMVNAELAKAPKDRQFHMMYIITKHDGLPLKELAQLKIPKFFHFSITSLGGTKYEPGVMKPDHLLDRIGALINDKILNPNLITIRIDPIIPGVTKKEDIRHIIERGLALGIKQYKFSVMDSYGYTSIGERCETEQDRYIIKKMTELGYDWDTYYGRNANGTVNFNAKQEYIEDIYRYMDDLAGELKFFVNTCGEAINQVQGLKNIKSAGCVNVQAMNAAMGTSDIAHTAGNQRQNCSCYGNIVDALRYDDNCASSCVYCYAKHNSNAALQYYNPDGTLKINRFTEIYTPEEIVPIEYDDKLDAKFKADPTYTLRQFRDDIQTLTNSYNEWKLERVKNKTRIELSYKNFEKAFNWNQIPTLNHFILGVNNMLINNEQVRSILKDTNSELASAVLNGTEFTGIQMDDPALALFFDMSYSDPTQLQMTFDANESTEKSSVTQTTAPKKEIQVSSHKYSDTINKIQRYLDVAINQQNNEKPINELDTREALYVVQQQMNNLGVQVNLLDTDADMEQQGLPGNTEAAVKNGEIFVNLSRANVTSPIHEFMHLVFAVMKQNDFSAFSNLMNEMRGVKEFDDIFSKVNNSEYYNKLIESDRLEEAFVRYLSGILQGEINTSDAFEIWYNKNMPVLNKVISETFGTPPIIDLLSFLKQPFASLTKYGSEMFMKKQQSAKGYSDNKYKVDISGKIMDFIQSNMDSLIQEGKCK